MVQDDHKYSWGNGTYTLDAQGAASELGCSINKYCWGMMGMRSNLPPQRFVEKCCTCPEHGGVDSDIHKRSIEGRDDAAVKAIILKHILDANSGRPVGSLSPFKKRVLTPTEDGRGKKHKANTDGDGPSGSFSMLELFAGLCSFALAALLGSWPVQLSTFCEISPPAIAYSEHFFAVKKLWGCSYSACDAL